MAVHDRAQVSKLEIEMSSHRAAIIQRRKQTRNKPN